MSVHVRLNRVDRRFDDQLDADGGGEMDDRIAGVDHLCQQRLVGDRVDRVVEPGLRLQVSDVVDRAGREVVQNEDLVAALEQRLSEVGAYESGSSGYQHTQRSVLLRVGRHGFPAIHCVRGNEAEAIGKLRTAATT